MEKIHWPTGFPPSERVPFSPYPGARWCRPSFFSESSLSPDLRNRTQKEVGWGRKKNEEKSLGRLSDPHGAEFRVRGGLCRPDQKRRRQAPSGGHLLRARNETTGVSRPDFPAEQSNLSCLGERRDLNGDAFAFFLGAGGARGNGFDGPEICMCVGAHWGVG